MPDTMLNPQMEYETWDTFKRALESKVGRWLTVDIWLRTKPKKPLPWNDVDLQICWLEVLKIRREYNWPSKMREISIKQVKTRI